MPTFKENTCKAASVIAVSGRVAMIKSNPKRRFAIPLRPSIMIRSLSSRASVSRSRSAFFEGRPSFGPEQTRSFPVGSRTRLPLILDMFSGAYQMLMRYCARLSGNHFRAGNLRCQGGANQIFLMVMYTKELYGMQIGTRQPFFQKTCLGHPPPITSLAYKGKSSQLGSFLGAETALPVQNHRIVHFARHAR